MNNTSSCRNADPKAIPLTDSEASPLNYPGGKAKVAKDLRRFVPKFVPDTVYVDAFGGGAAMALAVARLNGSEPNRFLIRDKFGPTINYWRALRDYPIELVKYLDELFFCGKSGRDIFNIATESIKNWQLSTEASIKAAAGYYISSHMGWPQTLLKVDKTSYSAIRDKEWLPSARFRTGRLLSWHELVADWDFREQDYKDTMAEAIVLGEKAFVFIDPPYNGQGRSIYGMNFDDKDHDNLAKLVSKAAGHGAKVMVTINDSPENRKRYAGHHQIRRWQTYGSRKGDTCNGAMELVILTYEAPFFDSALAANGWEEL